MEREDEEVFGYAGEEARGESLDIIVPERFREAHWEGYDEAMERGSSTYDRGERLSVPSTTKGGEQISIEFTVTLVRDGGGELSRVAAIVRDVTDRWEAEEERKQRIQGFEDRVTELESGDAE